MGTIYNINIPQGADACEGYHITHYILSFAGSSDVNHSIFMLGPSSTNDASRIEITLNYTDGIHQNVQYHFQISAVNIIGSSTSSGMEFCKSRIVLTCTCYHIRIPPVDAFIWDSSLRVLINKSTSEMTQTKHIKRVRNSKKQSIW